MVKNKGEQYECGECGLVVLVQNPCECSDECELVCCEKPMKQKTEGSKEAAKTKATSEKSK